MREESKMQNPFDDKAQSWDTNPMQIERNRAIAGALRRRIRLSTEMRALDYGAGTGLLSLELASNLGLVLAVDTSAGMLDVLKAKVAALGDEGLRIETLMHDLSTGPLLAGPFDLVYTAMTLHHVEDIDTLLNNFATLLQQGGHLAIAELESEDGSFHGGEHVIHHHGFHPDDLARRLEGLGFASVGHERVFTINRDGASYPVFLVTGRKS